MTGLYLEIVGSMPGCRKLSLNLYQTTNSLDRKAFAGNKLNAAVMMISFLDGLENTVGKGENAGYQQFLLFPQCFQSLLP